MAGSGDGVRSLINPDQLQGVEARLTRSAAALSRPERLGRLQLVLLVLLLLWSINSLAQLFWVVWPTPTNEAAAGGIVNPATSGGPSGVSRGPISLEGALGLGLFGNPAENLAAEALAESAAEESSRDGIEDGARETRLALRLTGIVASTNDGLGSAVIEAKNEEQIYAVGDELPVSGDVTLAKVMPTQVVLNNGGTYELLKLFEDNPLSLMAASATPAPDVSRTVNARREAATSQDPESDEDVTAAEVARVAQDLRQQFYDDPQSLAQLVSVAAVRDNAGIRGYRVSPGRNPEQFRALGFRAGDVITAVNGLSLNDPANTVRLYQMMREATDATFEIERDGASTSLSVSIGALP